MVCSGGLVANPPSNSRILAPSMETLGILNEIESLVSDHRQVVSYKWLSRNFLVSSNAAKKLLEELVIKHGDGLEVVYTVTGWLKNDSPTYHVRLVPRSKLAEAKKDFDDNCSVHVYSVQASFPKDAAALWNAELLQAAELFKHLSAADNCLRDNRFSGILNSAMKFNIEGGLLSSNVPQSRSEASAPSGVGSSKRTESIPQPQPNKVQESCPKVSLQSPRVAGPVKIESDKARSLDIASKLTTSSSRGKSPLPANSKKSGQNSASSMGSESSLANMFGRASTKVKSVDASKKADIVTSNTSVSAEAQICEQEALDGGSSDDDGPNVNFRRASNGGGKKRRVVLDHSDGEDIENADKSGLPDPQSGKSSLDQKLNNRTTNLGNSSSDERREEKIKVKQEKTSYVEDKQPSIDRTSSLQSGMTMDAALKTVQGSCLVDSENKKDKVVEDMPAVPRRRKVLKTRIDERGREVTEVVWEGEETRVKNSNENVPNKAESLAAKTESNTVANPVNRPAAVKNSPAVGSSDSSHLVGKGGNKKGGNVKDPKQGNILSFFKRV